MVAPPISIITFACEVCGFVHSSGEVPFRVHKFACDQVGEERQCAERAAGTYRRGKD